MKKLFLVSSILICSILSGQNAWYNQAAFGGTPRAYGIGFSIGTNGYIGLGSNNDSARTDLWKFDANANAWIQVANLPAQARIGAAGFALGNLGYVGMGKGTTQLNDFYSYDPVGNTWTQLSPFPGAARSFSMIFTIGNYAYLGCGRDETSYTLYNDFWKYDPSTDTWSPLAAFPGSIRKSGIAFAIGGNGYMGMGTYTSYYHDFYKYDTTSNSWTACASFPGGDREGAYSCSIGNTGYVTCGGSPGWPYTNYTDLWQYDAGANAWSALSSFSGNGRRYGSGFVINSCLFTCNGCYSNFDPTPFYTGDFHCYCLDFPTGVPEKSNSAISFYPNPFSSATILHTNISFTDATLSIVNCFGQTIKKSQHISGTSCSIFRDDLPAGIYFICLTEGKEIIATGKIIITD
jgi:N-acetylneuraminic acid mutarotase